VVVLRVPARRASIGGITQLPAGLLSIWKRYSGMSLMTAFTPTGYILRWMDETGATRELEPAHGTITLGRAATNDLVLNDQAVSRVHAQIEVSDTGVLIRDQNSSNGLYVNSERVSEAVLRPGDEIGIGQFTILVDTPEGMSNTDSTVLYQPAPAVEAAVTIPSVGVVPDAWLAQPVLSEHDLIAAGVEVKVSEYATLGAGLGSFIWADYLRIAGASADDIMVVGFGAKPHGKYQRFCVNSQIPPHERLRSHSESCPDNIWGFPSYGTREIFSELKRLHLRSAASITWSLFGEPAIATTFTPRSGIVFTSIDKECARIGYQRMLRQGRVRAIRKSAEGRLLAIVSESDEHRRKHFVVSARFLHLCIGYPAIQLLPELAEYRESNPGSNRIVNAYEEHEHIYQALRRQGGTVVVRGRGIVASRIIQRLYEERANNKNIIIVHLHRTRLTHGNRFGLSRRRVENQAEFQPFNWPKSSWTGEYRDILENASNEERKRLLDIWGGTTTANRPDWRHIISQGLKEGWYRSEFGAAKQVTRGRDGRVMTRIQNSLAGGGTLELEADYVIDCTGLISSPDRSVPISDLIKTYGIPLNKMGKVQVSNDFEITALRHGDARLYAAGAVTLGGPHAAVDSFLGLQYADLRAVTAIQKQSPRKLRRIWGMYSLGQWLSWVRGKAP
jgi:pSer/pThr/pTyr-binding forkhead associated (FHA) protein